MERIGVQHHHAHLGLVGGHLHEPVGPLEAGRHHRQRLLLARLTSAEFLNHLFVPGIAQQVIATQALQGHNLALFEKGGRTRDGVVPS